MDSSKTEGMCITITEDGPYIVTGSVPLRIGIIEQGDGHKVTKYIKEFPLQESYALCRCGLSQNPPFCDGAHVAAGFDGTEGASRQPYNERAEVFPGKDMDLLDDNRCAFARFCHRKQGDVWTLTEIAGSDEHLKSEALHASQECPAGRLTHVNKAEGKELEPELEPYITILEDPEKGASSGLYVQGGIKLVGADGTEYENRNRYMLCRCGQSQNKPFCDASHVPARFNDGLTDM